MVANGSADAATQLQSAHEMQGIRRPPAGAVVLQAVLAGTLALALALAWAWAWALGVWVVSCL